MDVFGSIGQLVAVLVLLLGHCAADPRLISYQDLIEKGASFTDPGITHYSQLLFDIARNQVIVGARDALFRLSLGGLDRLEKAVWTASSEKATLCQNKGQSERDCHNFIKVLLTNGTKLFTCGTNAFYPQCTWRELEEVNRVREWVIGVAKCPYSPWSNSTGLISENDGQYFAGSPIDFSGADAAITVDKGPSYIRTSQADSRILNRPQFVGSFETPSYVYFLFREVAIEYINCGKIIYSRIARVCKNDRGGGQHMLRDTWTTFLKARLNCSIPGEFPFYFDNIQAMTYLLEQGIIYATFTTPRNSIAGSAVCAFNMSAVEAAFGGPFKHQKSAGSAWERRSMWPTASAHFTCSDLPQPPDHQLLELSKYQLMDSAVQPTTLTPLYRTTLETLTHIAVETVSTKLHKDVHVLYIANTEGLIKKISVITRTLETCVLEIWKPIPNGMTSNILTLKFALDSIYVGMEHGMLRISVEHCRRHGSKAACLNAQDPHCGWDDHLESCGPPPTRNPLVPHWHQHATTCPILNQPVDGGWSAWSAWSQCQHTSTTGGTTSSDGLDGCLCSTRSCNNPTPEHGGRDCSGITIRVTNCTVHGSWSSWSSWSACSQTCNMAVKTRRRTCGNPAPQFGGRVCVGQDRQEAYCHNNPPCPVTVSGRDGEWSSWGSWGECSAKCGPGYRVRRRECNKPAPLPPGLDCQGCHIDYQSCEVNTCVDSRRLSSWTVWAGMGNGTQKRFRFSCKAPVQDPALIKLALYKVEERICSNDGMCTRTERGDGEDAWSEWSAWSPCSVDCGEGLQHRARTCEAPMRQLNSHHEDCPGPASVTRTCTKAMCRGEWGCWGEWSECSVSCGTGVRQRMRECLQPGSTAVTATDCPGQPVSQEPCHLPSCESLLGWDSWSMWSPSCESGAMEQHRSRVCLASHNQFLCRGPDTETRMCYQQHLPDDQQDYAINEAAVVQEDGSVSMVTVVVLCCVTFLCGGALGCAGWLYYSGKGWWGLRRGNRGRVPGSPHYISSKQNPYVTVPLKEMHSPKRAPSFRGASPGSSTPKLFSKVGGCVGVGSSSSGGGTTLGGSGPDYETATIKRNSHSLITNGHVRQDIDQDKFY